jgi:hypothetical protein
MAVDVKQALNIRQVVEHYGFNVNRAGLIKCPIHREKTPSMKIYNNNKGFYCFGCNAGGTVIDFVMKLFGVDCKTAINKLIEDFRLNNTVKLTKFEKMKIAVNESLRKKKQQEYEKREEEYWIEFEKYAELDVQKIRNKPKIGEEMNDLFIEALQKLCYQEFMLDLAEVRIKKYEFR